MYLFIIFIKIPISDKKFSLNSLNLISGSSTSELLNTSINVYKTFKIILKFIESVQLILVFL